MSGVRTRLHLGFFLKSPSPLQEGTGHPPQLDHHNSPLADSGLGCLSTQGTRGVVAVKHITLLQYPEGGQCQRLLPL